MESTLSYVLVQGQVGLVDAGLVESLGGQTIYLHDLKTWYSSTAIIQEIRKRYG